MDSALDVKKKGGMFSTEMKLLQRQLKSSFSVMHFTTAHHYNSNISLQIPMAGVLAKWPFKNVDAKQ